MKQINTYINEKLRLTTKQKYSCQPKTKNELQEIILQRIEDEGPTCDLNDIDVSKIIDMSWLFDADDKNIFKDFNGDVSMWDVSNVKYMRRMFNNCKKFNCDLSTWNVSNVTNMECMFAGCEHFNCDLSKWNVSNVKDMDGMFANCINFNCDLSKWNVQNVKYMRYAFKKCPTYPDWYDKETCES